MSFRLGGVSETLRAVLERLARSTFPAVDVPADNGGARPSERISASACCARVEAAPKIHIVRAEPSTLKCVDPIASRISRPLKLSETTARTVTRR